MTRTYVSKSFWNKCLKNALSLLENQHQHVSIFEQLMLLIDGWMVILVLDYDSK